MGTDSYTYDTLIKKKAIPIVELPTEIPRSANGEIDNNAVIAEGRENAKKQKNPNNTETSTYVRVDDIGLDVLLAKKGMHHGLARSPETAMAVMRIGDILRDSIVVNELNGSDTRKTEMSYVLLGVCREGENLYAVRSVVSKLKNDVTNIDVYQLGAVKSKKRETPTSAQGGTAVTEQSSLISSESPTISISDFLEFVKTIPLVNEIFSADVAARLGVTRTTGTLTSDLRYSLPESGESADFVYTREQYERFGWAREAGGITFNELNDLESKIKTKRSVSDFYHSQQGEFIVAVNNDPNRGQGVNNVLVFLKGTKANHTITRTIRFDARTEMEMEEFTDNVFSERTFDSEACTILEEVGIATEYRRRGAPSHSEYLAKKRKRGESGGDIQNSSPDRSGNQRRGATEDGGEAGGGDAVSGRRYSLPEATLAATEGSVRARQEEYEPRALERVTGAAQRTYIEGVNAQYGIERLLRKNGMSRAEAESLMQITRAAESQAQAMIGGRQYDIFSDNPEDMGEGLMQILEPVRRWSDERQTLLQQYLLHSLNVDRMTLLIFSAFFAKALVISRAFVLQ